MSEHQQRAFRYRQRAEELRMILPDLKDPHTRKAIERIIRDYDKLAEMKQQLAKS